MLLLHTFTRGYIVWWWTQIRESRSLFCRRGWRGPSSDGPRFQGRHFEEKPESEVLNFGRGGSWTPNLRKLSWKLVENVEDVGKKPINRRIGIKKMDFAWNLRDEIQFYSSQKLWLHGVPSKNSPGDSWKQRSGWADGCWPAIVKLDGLDKSICSL